MLNSPGCEAYVHVRGVLLHKSKQIENEKIFCAHECKKHVALTTHL